MFVNWRTAAHPGNVGAAKADELDEVERFTEVGKVVCRVVLRSRDEDRPDPSVTRRLRSLSRYAASRSVLPPQRLCLAGRSVYLAIQVKRAPQLPCRFSKLSPSSTDLRKRENRILTRSRAPGSGVGLDVGVVVVPGDADNLE